MHPPVCHPEAGREEGWLPWAGWAREQPPFTANRQFCGHCHFYAPTFTHRPVWDKHVFLVHSNEQQRWALPAWWDFLQEVLHAGVRGDGTAGLPELVPHCPDIYPYSAVRPPFLSPWSCFLKLTSCLHLPTTQVLSKASVLCSTTVMLRGCPQPSDSPALWEEMHGVTITVEVQGTSESAGVSKGLWITSRFSLTSSLRVSPELALAFEDCELKWFQREWSMEPLLLSPAGVRRCPALPPVSGGLPARVTNPVKTQIPSVWRKLVPADRLFFPE